MDATDLQFLDETFTVATSFFTMMYIPNDMKPIVLAEVSRVLKKGGKFFIWDTEIPEEICNKKFFVIPLKVVMPSEIVETGYGVKLKKQDLQSLKLLALEAGFIINNEETQEHTFYLELEKEG